MLNKSKGNMYPFVSHTWNIIKGKCPHDCYYCYMKRFKQNDIRFDRKEFKTDLGEGNFIFVGSSCDMWAESIPDEWIIEIIKYCSNFGNKYLFQTKNPKKMLKLRTSIFIDAILGTTIETNRSYTSMGKAPLPQERAQFMNLLSKEWLTMVSIEPIMDFDLEELINLVGLCNPEWVSIGADSRNCKLPEPNKIKIEYLISALKTLTEVKLKDNLKRIL